MHWEPGGERKKELLLVRGCTSPGEISKWETEQLSQMREVRGRDQQEEDWEAGEDLTPGALAWLQGAWDGAVI